jgi:hypothetical protein
MQDHGISVILDGFSKVHPDLLPHLESFVLRRLNDTYPRDHTKCLKPVSGELSVGYVSAQLTKQNYTYYKVDSVSYGFLQSLWQKRPYDD